MNKKYVPVVIVGGSLVGLSTSLFLSVQGIPSLLVERHAGLSVHPLKLGNRAGLSLEESAKERIDDLALSFGYRYDSDAIIHPTDDARFITLNPRDLDGEPGTRAPHVWLEYKGKRLSTIDLFQKHFVLFVGKKGDTEGFRALCEETGILLDIYLMDKDLLDVNQCWHDQYGITFTRAVLVRPDGFVAWRQKDTETESKPAFLDALKQLFPLKFVH